MNTHVTPAPSTPSRPARSLWIFVPAPPLFIITFVIGMQLARLVPQSIVPTSWEPFTLVLGIGAMVAAIALIVWAPMLFLVHRTTIVPHGTSKELVTAGPYRVTRNPMYLALAIGYVGVAVVLNVVWPLLLLAVPVWVMSAKVIPTEERSLTQAFGDDYRAYQARVGRWL